MSRAAGWRRRGAAQSREHADDGSEQDSDDCNEQIKRGDRDLETEREVFETHRLITQPVFNRPLGHGHEKPLLEDEEGGKRNADSQRKDCDPRMAPHPAHIKA